MKLFLIILASLFLVISVHAQDSDSIEITRAKPEKSFLRQDRPWTVGVPLWIPGYRGDFAYGDISLEGEDGGDPGDPGDPGDDKPGDIISRLFSSTSYLKFFFMFNASYEKNRFISHLDALSVNVGTSVKFNYNNKDIVSVAARTVISRLYLGYSLFETENRNEKLRFNIYGLAGARFHYIEIYSALNNVVNELNVNPVWVEPVVGIQTRLTLQKWKFLLSGDVGGFNINNKLSSMLQIRADYRLSNLLALSFGWLDWNINYKGNILNEELTMKVRLSGPSASLSFHF